VRVGHGDQDYRDGLSIYLSTYQAISIYLPTSINLPIYPSVYRYPALSIYLYLYLQLYLYICISVIQRPEVNFDPEVWPSTTRSTTQARLTS